MIVNLVHLGPSCACLRVRHRQKYKLFPIVILLSNFFDHRPQLREAVFTLLSGRPHSFLIRAQLHSCFLWCDKTVSLFVTPILGFWCAGTSCFTPFYNACRASLEPVFSWSWVVTSWGARELFPTQSEIIHLRAIWETNRLVRVEFKLVSIFFFVKHLLIFW